jgi:DNA-binding Lrp family transcriptional regulator
MTTLDDIDRALLAALKRDARTPTAALARRVGASRTTVQARLERLERRGVIRGYTVIAGEIDGTQRIRATILAQIEPRATPAVVAALNRVPEVETVITTAGRFDMIVRLAAPDTPALDAALDRIGLLEGVRGLESLIHLTVRVDRGL